MSPLWNLEKIEYGGGLHGLSSIASPLVAVHFHGSWGNFYENPFALGAVEPYREAGMGYASVNLLGHDGGTITEDLASLSDLQAWIDHFVSRSEGVVLQAHSLAALKVMKILSVEHSDKIRGAVLLSPFDLPAFYARADNNREIERRRKDALKVRKRLGGAGMLPLELFDIWPISIDTYIQAVQIGGPLDAFPSRDASVGRLVDLRVPTLVLLGGDDFAATPSNQDVAGYIANQAPRVEVALIEGAPHNFAGHEQEVYERIREFASANLSAG